MNTNTFNEIFTVTQQAKSRQTNQRLEIWRTSVPAMPIANPMSDSCRAGASLVPSPVTATTSPNARSSFTKVCLSDGEDLAMTYQS